MSGIWNVTVSWFEGAAEENPVGMSPMQLVAATVIVVVVSRFAGQRLGYWLGRRAGLLKKQRLQERVKALIIQSQLLDKQKAAVNKFSGYEKSGNLKEVNRLYDLLLEGNVIENAGHSCKDS